MTSWQTPWAGGHTGQGNLRKLLCKDRLGHACKGLALHPGDMQSEVYWIHQGNLPACALVQILAEPPLATSLERGQPAWLPTYYAGRHHTWQVP